MSYVTRRTHQEKLAVVGLLLLLMIWRCGGGGGGDDGDGGGGAVPYVFSVAQDNTATFMIWACLLVRCYV
jgi:hypothetical protein